MEENLQVSNLMGKPLKEQQSFAHMLHAKEKSCINISMDDFHIMKDQYLIRLKESIFINHFKLC